MLKVSYGAMDNAASALNTALNSLTSQLADLEAQNRDLAAAWQGCGSDEYQALARQFHDQALQVVPGVSPLVRDARGLIYVTAGTRVTPQELQVIQSTTGISGHFTSRTLGANDTIYSLADQQYGEHNDATIRDILKANHLNSVADIQPGQTLIMPSLQAGDY